MTSRVKKFAWAVRFRNVCSRTWVPFRSQALAKVAYPSMHKYGYFGLITPPVGMNVFVLKANLPKVPVGTIFRGLVPFIAVDVLRLALLVVLPSISLVLVQWMRSSARQRCKTKGLPVS